MMTIESKDVLSEEDFEILAELEEEEERKGHFERIFPLKSNVDTYARYFEYPRYHNSLVWAYLRTSNGLNLLLNHKYPSQQQELTD